MNKVVTENEWLEARKELLKREKDFNRLRDELSEARRGLPWVKVKENYTFQGAEKKETLRDLFGDRSQLIVYHFMLGPDKMVGCSGCSFMVDNLPADLSHLEQKDVKFVVVSRAPIEQIQAFKKRMNWNFKWVSSYNSSFNFDYHMSYTEEQLKSGKVVYNYETTDASESELPGLSVFAKDDSANIYHTYSTFSRGLDMLINTYHYLDLTPKGRDETSAMSWVKRHDEY